MLHLALAGNLLQATGGTPRLYGSTPAYPATIFKDSTPVNLSGATEATIKLFVKIEQPVYDPDGTAPGTGTGVLADYDTIGHFYDGILEGLKELSKDEGTPLFDPNSEEKQLSTDHDRVWYYPDLKPILSLDGAVYGLKLIIQQGEGVRNVDKVDDPEGTKWHYDILNQFFPSCLKPTMLSTIPGPISMRLKIFMSLCELLMLWYSYLLLSIEKLWDYSGPGRGNISENNIMDLMREVLPTLARFLVSQPTKSEPGRNADPPVNHYDIDPTNSFANALKQLKEEIKRAIEKFPDSNLKDI